MRQAGILAAADIDPAGTQTALEALQEALAPSSTAAN
jgi:hypothetical protein